MQVSSSLPGTGPPPPRDSGFSALQELRRREGYLMARFQKSRAIIDQLIDVVHDLLNAVRIFLWASHFLNNESRTISVKYLDIGIMLCENRSLSCCYKLNFFTQR